MKISKLSLRPQKIGSDIWYYEERGKIDIYVGVDAINLVKPGHTLRFSISKRKLRNSLQRMSCPR